ncbi:CapA family protein, partial [Priestia megaterium]|uniref:CapA family protein n=1 Tax=Priestia megaterium TaxID=1404 RepID=UPI0039A08710
MLPYPRSHHTKELTTHIKHAINSLKQKPPKIIILHFHSPSQPHYLPHTPHHALANYTIHSPADFILRHHPHLVQ